MFFLHFGLVTASPLGYAAEYLCRVPHIQKFSHVSTAEHIFNSISITGANAMQCFVGDLPESCTDEDLMDVFGQYDKVNDVRINQKNGKGEFASTINKQPFWALAKYLISSCNSLCCMTCQYQLKVNELVTNKYGSVEELRSL